LSVVIPALLHQLLDGDNHLCLDSAEPILNGVFELNWLREWHLLTLARDHLHYIHVVLDLETHNVVETGTKILLDDLDVVGLGQNFQELIIG
jgi:hypothetical protein